MAIPLLVGAIFGGGTRVNVTLTNNTTFEAQGGGTQDVRLTILNDGSATADTFLTSGSFSPLNWASPRWSGIGDGYEVRLTLNSGDSPTSGATVGSWLEITSDRFWAWTTSGFLNANATLEIRPIGGAVAASDTFDVTVTGGLP